jgi:prophage regulatory protein
MPADTVTISFRPQKHLRACEVMEIVPFSKVHIYRLIKKGEFPRPVRLGKKRVGWPENVLAAWLDAKAGKTAT